MAELLDTPLGRVAVETSGTLVKEIHLGARARGAAERPTTPVARDLARYFSGESVAFDDYEVDLTGYTDFQRRGDEGGPASPPPEGRAHGESAPAAGGAGAAPAGGDARGGEPPRPPRPAPTVRGA